MNWICLKDLGLLFNLNWGMMLRGFIVDIHLQFITKDAHFKLTQHRRLYTKRGLNVAGFVTREGERREASRERQI